MHNADEKPAPFVLTERDLLAAIFNGVSALAKELTGKRLTVVCPTESGNMTVYGDSTAKLTPASTEEVERRPVGLD